MARPPASVRVCNEGDGRCPGSHHHHIGQRACCRFQCAIHGTRNQHHDQETDETEARLPLFHVAIGNRSLGGCRCHLLGRLSRPILRPSMVEIRLANYPTNFIHQAVRQWLYARQLVMVHARLFTPGRQRHRPQVSFIPLQYLSFQKIKLVEIIPIEVLLSVSNIEPFHCKQYAAIEQSLCRPIVYQKQIIKINK